jgi:Holliday junction DNA helicase RuvB
MTRLISNKESAEEIIVENNPNLRPKNLDNFIGQSKTKDNLKVFLRSAKNRSEALDHVLIYGPPGLGKTTLSHIIANEMGANIKTTSGPVLGKVGDLAAILTNLQEKDVLFIDEIHRLNRAVEESLYSALEDFALDIVIGDGPTARMLRIDLPPFTLVGATTRLGLLTNPLKDRFGIPISLDFYTSEELKEIVSRQASKIGLQIDGKAALEIARRSRGTPRIALRLLRRVRDFADDSIDVETTHNALSRLNVDDIGLDNLDHKYLTYILKTCNGGPIGIETIVAGISEDQTTVEDVIEPYLLQIGFITKSPKGRILTENCISHIKKYIA